jgi:hypothetical protein
MPFVFGKAFSYNPATGELRLGKFPLSALASKDPHRIVRKKPPRLLNLGGAFCPNWVDDTLGYY